MAHSPSVVPIGAVSSPAALAPLGGQLSSLAPVQTPSPKRNSNTVILAIVIIAIIVFLIFLFTKMNTMYKQIKELQNDRDQMAKSSKLIEAIAQKLGLRQTEDGEIEELETDDDEDDDEKECENEDECRDEDESKQQPMDLGQPPFPPFLSQMLGGQFGSPEVLIVSGKTTSGPSGVTTSGGGATVEEDPKANDGKDQQKEEESK